MYKVKRTAVMFLAIVMSFLFIFDPVLAAYANIPGINVPGINVPVVKPPAGAPLKKLEIPARVKGVNYEFRDEVKRIPEGTGYDLAPLTLDKFASFQMQDGLQSRTGDLLKNAAEGQSLSIDRINGIKYPAGSKLMTLPSTASVFSPAKDEIYIDEEMGTAFRVLDTQASDSEGNKQYVVETPELADVFKSYTIPEQTISLTTGNIAYMAPGFELSPESGMQSRYEAKAGISDYVSFSQVGNKHIITLKPGKTIFEYPSKEEKDKTEEEKKKAEKEKFEGDWWEKDQSGDLRGVEDESSLSVEVKVKEGTIIVEDPEFHAYFDLNPLTTHVVADFYFDAKATADVTLEGDVTFNKTIEKCVYGYDIDLGKVLGDEKGNKAFVGIFLVIGVEGKIHVEVRTITTGDARAGFAYKAYGYGSIPYFVGPYATYRPASFDMSFTVNGEINTTLACVPQVGVIIWGKELGVLQIWVGFKSKAAFSASGGGGSGGAQDFKASGSISLDAFGELVGYLLGSKYSIFYIDYPLYKGEWSIGEEASGGGGDAAREVKPIMYVTADAYYDTIKGNVLFDTAGKLNTGYTGDNAAIESTLRPYSSGRYEVEVWDYGKVKYRIPGLTDNSGNFMIKDAARYNIRPSDKIVVKIENSPVFEVEGRKFKVVGNSKEIKSTVPFSALDFKVDSVNDIITGWVSGNYNGPVQLTLTGTGFNTTMLTANAVNGMFTYEYPIDQRLYSVHAVIGFEDHKYPDNQGVVRERSIDAFTINLYNDFKEDTEASVQNSKTSFGREPFNKAGNKVPKDTTGDLNLQDIEGNKFIKPVKVFGTITNKGDMGWIQNQGEEYGRGYDTDGTANNYNGNVKITSIQVQSALEAMLEDSKGPHDNWLPKPKSDWVEWTAETQVQPAMELRPEAGTGRIMELPTSAAKFEFNDPDVVAYRVEIEYEGLKLTREYNPFVYHYNNNQQSLNDFIGPLKEAVSLVTEEKTDAVVNPADVTNQWNSSWITQIGTMQLEQKGASLTGSIIQGDKVFKIEGTVSGGKFKGSCLIPSDSGFGDIVSFEMDISADGKTINFKNIGAGNMLKTLNGSNAVRQLERGYGIGDTP